MSKKLISDEKFCIPLRQSLKIMLVHFLLLNNFKAPPIPHGNVGLTHVVISQGTYLNIDTGGGDGQGQ